MKLLLPILMMMACFPGIATSQPSKTLSDFLANPFDLQKFKKAKGQSNSGGTSERDYWYKPNVKGVYYNFYLFPAEKTRYSYIKNGDEKFRGIYDNPFGIVIDTYKPFGKYEKDFLDPTETLISFYTTQNDDDLPELAFIGLDTTAVKTKLPFEFTRFEKCIVYFADNNLLVLGYWGPLIAWLRYTKLNFTVTRENIPPELLRYD